MDQIPEMGGSPLYEITTDGVTVWINSETALLGRFGVLGIDIHDVDPTGHCLHCTHNRTTKEDWNLFQADMYEYHNVFVSDNYMPKRFR
jgi:hypothetical protein